MCVSFTDFVVDSRQKGRYIWTLQVALEEEEAREKTDKSFTACISKVIGVIYNTNSLFFPKKWLLSAIYLGSRTEFI